MIFCPENFYSQNHACTLNTIVNIEQFIAQNSGLYSKTELWEKLPKKIMYQSYKVVLQFLLSSRKITIQGKKVVWMGKKEKFELENYEAQNHASTLTTICNVYEFISKNSGTYSKTELWNNLPKKIMYQSYKVILEYLINSDLIAVKERRVIISGGDSK